jgi:hypothetical protein
MCNASGLEIRILNVDPDPRSRLKLNADPTGPDPDLNHCFTQAKFIVYIAVTWIVQQKRGWVASGFNQ